MRTESPTLDPLTELAAAVPVPLVGTSEHAIAARAALADAAGRRGPILVTVEPGCRPQTLAMCIHDVSRTGGALIAVDCASGDAAEIDRRLFGAAAERAPRDLETVGPDAAVVAAGEGTLFLDNIDELPASAQRRLARVLRDAEVRVAGSKASVAALFRLVGATAKDLDVEAREGRFRIELLRRFTARISVTPLRQRSQDMAALLERLAADAGRGDVTITAPAVTILSAMPWPRNIDELSEVFARMLEATNGTVRQEDVLQHLPIRGSFSRPDLTASLRDARRRFEREYIAAVLERHQWRMSEAARTLGIERANLYRKARQLGITRGGRGDASVVNR